MKSIIPILFFVLFYSIGISQSSPDNESYSKCPATIESVEKRKQSDPEYRELFELFERKIREGSNLRNPDCSGGNIVVPVAFHFQAGVVLPAQEECMISLVEEQLSLLNIEISGQDPQTEAYGVLQSCFGTDIGNACIEFCLATLDHPEGYGLSEGSPAITFGKVNFNNTNPNTAYVPTDPNWAGYLNVFVGDLGTSNASGESPLFGNFDGDGVIVRPCNFGGPERICPGINTSGSCGGIYNEGNTLVHEVGHYFGLQHTWGSNPPGCGGDDGIADTPLSGATYLNFQACNFNVCQDLPQTCGSVDMVMNYMTYASDACMYMFTSGQADVMYNWATTKGWTTSTPAKCAPPITPVTDFSFRDTEICPSGCVSFKDNSLNNPTSWMWNFSVSSGDIEIDKMSSNFADPSVCITGGSSGTITASLTTANSAGSDGPVTKEIAINVLNGNDPRCSPCTQWASPIYRDLSRANACLENCPSSPAPFQVYENESYRLAALQEGVTYTFDFCDGYSSDRWEAVITIIRYNESPGEVISVTAGCSATFTPPSFGNYLAIITSVNGCGGNVGSSGNGRPFFSCVSGCGSICGATFTDDGGTVTNYVNRAIRDYVICPDGTDLISVEFSDISLPANQTDYLEVYEGSTVTGTPKFILEGNSVGNLPQGGKYRSAASGECLTFRFIADGSSSNNGDGWLASINCCDDSATTPGLFNAEECADAPINEGENFSLTFNNNCTPDGTITDVSTVRMLKESTRTGCDGPVFNKQLFYLFEGKNSTGMEQDIVINCVVDDPSIRNVEIALYGPANIDCPGTIDPGALIVCDRQSNSGSSNNRLNATASISTTQQADGSTYLLVIGTDGSGSFNIDGQITFSSLPVDWVSFEASARENHIQLNWVTASETNNQGFEILKSINDIDEFINIGFVQGQGDSRSLNHYEFIDRDVIPGVTYYYRLKQNDFDGNFSLSSVVQATLNHDNKAAIFPNPVREGFFNVILDGHSSNGSRIEIYTIEGRLVKSQTFTETSFQEVILDQKGIYLARIISGGEVLLIEKLIVL